MTSAEDARQEILAAIRDYSRRRFGTSWVKNVEDEFMRSSECPDHIKELAQQPDVGWPIMIKRDEVAMWDTWDFLMGLEPGTSPERRLVLAQAHLKLAVTITAEAEVVRGDPGAESR